MSGFIQRITQKVLLSLFAVAMAFGQSEVVVTAPPYYGVMSGTYTISGYALAASATVTSVQVTGLGPNFSGYAHYGDPTTGVCQNFSGWVGCNTGNVGWDLTVDTTTLTQGPGGISAIAALSAGQGTNWANIPDVIVDQPPTIQPTSTPPAGAGSGSFTFTANASTGPGSVQSINGWISQTFGSTPACAFSYQPGSSALGLLSDDGSSWQWADDGSDLSNSECDIGGYSSYNSSTGVLTFNITFFSGLQGPQYIWLDTTDDWLDSGWQAGIPWYAVPVVSGFAPASGAAGTPVTISGIGFGTSQGNSTVTFDGVAAANVTSWGPGSISANVPVGAMTGPIAVTVGGVTATSSGNFTVPVTSPAVSIDTLPAVLSGTLTMSGWAVDSAALINPNSLQISIGSSVIGTGPYFYYGYSRPDACSGQYQNWPGCPNVGWMDQLIDTTQLTQGPNQLLTVSAVTQGSSPVTGAAQSTVVVDQPLFAMGLPPSTSRGNGVFSFEVWSQAWSEGGLLDPQWISGWIASGLNKTPACAFTYWPDSGALALLNDAGDQWQWGTLGSVLSNSECRIEADSSYTVTTRGSLPILLLNLDITFLSGLQGNVQIWADAADEWLDAGWYSEETWNTVSPPPTILSFTPASAMANQQLTISGRNFITAQGTCGTVSLGGSQVPPANISTCTETSIVLTVPANAASGYVGVTVGSSTGQSSSSFTFQYFTMGSPSPTSITVQPGSSSTFSEVFAGFNSYNSTVQLSYSGGPSGLTFSPSSVLVSGVVNQAITATAAPGTAFGTYTIMIAASGTSTLRTLTVVVAPPPPVLSMDPLPAVISGWYQMSGWAVDGLTAIDPNSVQISVLGYSPAIVVGNATYGNFRSDMCTGQYQGWPGCPDVGWTYGFNASPSSVPQGNQTLQITAATLGPVPVTGSIQVATVIDDPPNLNFAPPASNSGSGAFTLTVTTDSAAETASLQWINGVIGPSLYGPPQCMFSYWPNYGALALLNDAGTDWVWGGLDPGLSNSNCQVSATAASGLGNSISSDGLTDTLTLNITFLSGLPGGTTEQIWAITSDANVGTDWEEFASNYNTNVYPPPPPVISTVSLPSSLVGNLYAQTLTASGGTPPYHWSASSGSLPPGLSVYDGGTFTGTPTVGGYYHPVLTVADSAGGNASVTLSQTVQDFALSQPSAVGIVQGGASATITVTSSTATGLSGPVALSCATSQGVAVQLSQGTINVGGSFTVTVSAPFTQGPSIPITAPYTVSLPITSVYTGQNEQVTKTISVQVTVNPFPTFTMGVPSANPAIVASVSQGSTATFTQTIIGQNGFSGTVILTPGAVYCTLANGQLPEVSNGSSGPITLRYNPDSVALSPSANTATVSGTITINTPGGLPANAYAYTFLTTATGVPNYGAGNYPTTAFTDVVPAVVGTVPPFSISGIPSSTAVYATGPSGAGTPVTVMVNPVNGSTPSEVTFSLNNQGFTAQTPVTQSTPAGSSWPATFNVYAATNATSGSVTINASAGSAGTVPFSMWLNVNPPFSLSASPGSETAIGGSAGYQISVSSGDNFAGPIGLSLSSSPPLPSGSSVGGVPATLTAPGATPLTVTVPPVLTPTTYNLTLTGTSGTLSTSVTVPMFVNPPTNTAPATMSWPVNGSILPTNLVSTIPFTWRKGFGVTQYQLSVGSTSGEADIYSDTFPPDTLNAAVRNLPTNGQNVWVTLKSAINGQFIPDPTGPQKCPSGGGGGGGGGQPHPTIGTTSATAYVLNSSQDGQPPNAVVEYTYKLDQGTPSGINCCYPDSIGCPGGVVNPDYPVQASLVDVSGSGETFLVSYFADDTAPTGNHPVSCQWTDPTTGASYTLPLIDGKGNGVAVYDATPVITSISQAVLYPGGHADTTIYGHNFGTTPTTLTFYTCTVGGDPPSGCAQTSDITFTPFAGKWQQESIEGTISLSDTPSSTSYYVQLTSDGEDGLSNGFQAGNPASQAQSNIKGTIQASAPPFTLSSFSLANGQDIWSATTYASNGDYDLGSVVNGYYAIQMWSFGATTRNPAAFKVGFTGALLNVSLSTDPSITGDYLLDVQVLQQGGAPAGFAFSQKPVHFVQGAGTVSNATMTGAFPSTITAQNYQFVWSAGPRTGTQPFTPFASTDHPIYTVKDIVGNCGTPCPQGSDYRVTAIRLGHAASAMQGEIWTAEALMAVEVDLGLMLGGLSATGTLDAAYVSNPWGQFDKPHPLDCLGSAALGAAEMRQLGYHTAQPRQAFPTDGTAPFGTNATLQESFPGPQAVAGGFTVPGGVTWFPVFDVTEGSNYYEGFIYVSESDTAPAQAFTTLPNLSEVEEFPATVQLLGETRCKVSPASLDNGVAFRVLTNTYVYYSIVGLHWRDAYPGTVELPPPNVSPLPLTDCPDQEIPQ